LHDSKGGKDMIDKIRMLWKSVGIVNTPERTGLKTYAICVLIAAIVILPVAIGMANDSSTENVTVKNKVNSYSTYFDIYIKGTVVNEYNSPIPNAY
jgi:uncharacterized membrane protein